MKKSGNLYLIPSLLGGQNFNYCLPPDLKNIVSPLKYFIVEDVRTARRFLKPSGLINSFEDINFFILNKHTAFNEIASFLSPALQGYDMGMVSEAGCPCIADPGAFVVQLAHEKNINVVPLVGPSSIVLSLMASGFNGQNFAFIGYLPIKQNERIEKIKEIEKNIYKHNQTQIFIEAPYRNQVLLEDILKTTNKNTKLCIAIDLTLENEYIKSKTIAQWQANIPHINKRQVVFLLYKDS